MARPSRYPREDVLEKAMQTFWQEGYHATGMANLVDVTDMRPGSLYASFKSKRGLFLASIDRYGQRSVERFRETLDNTTSPLEGIRRLLRKIARDVTAKTNRRSCLLVNSALELARHDHDIRNHINVYFNQIELLLQRNLKQARRNGELGTNKDPKAIAAFLLNNIWGLQILSVNDYGPRRAQDIVRLSLSVLD